MSVVSGLGWGLQDNSMLQLHVSKVLWCAESCRLTSHCLEDVSYVQVQMQVIARESALE
jgi:hypothetical protein